jgi:hypothetical protein
MVLGFWGKIVSFCDPMNMTRTILLGSLLCDLLEELGFNITIPSCERANPRLQNLPMHLWCALI